MNPVTQTICQHRSIRRFQKKDLSAEVKDTLLACAIRAPTAAMGHFYSIIEITEPTLRKDLYELSGGQESVLSGSFFLFVLDLRRSSLWADHLGVEREIRGFTALVFATIDASLAAQNLALAAESLGLGTVFIGMMGHKAYEVCELLSLPAEVLPIVGLVVGYPAEDPALRPRIPVAFLHHADRYRDMEPDDIEQALVAIGNHSGGTQPVERNAEERREFVRGILAGKWWVEGEKSLRMALDRQRMLE